MREGIVPDRSQEQAAVPSKETARAQVSERERLLRKLMAPLLLTAHGLTIFVAIVAAYWMRFHLAPALGVLEPIHPPGLGLYLPGILGGVVVLLMVFSYVGVYRNRRRLVRDGDYTATLKGCTVGTVLALALSYFTKSTHFSRLVFVLSWFNEIVLFYVLITLLSVLQRALVKRGLARSRFVIIGDSETGRALRRRLQADAHLGKEFVGFVSTQDTLVLDGAQEVVGKVEDVGRILSQLSVDHVYIASRDLSHSTILKILDECSVHQIQVDMLSDLYEILHGGATVQQVAGFPMVSLRQAALRRRQEMVKRWMDVVLSILFMVISIPLVVVIALAIRLDSPGPVIYSQVRVGKGGKQFRMYKFRSMSLDAEEQLDKVRPLNEAKGPIFKIRDDPRVTRVGRLLRKTSLDELPQLYNVLKGDMSLVGPRPPLPSEVEAYEEWHHRRLTVNQGMTGLWQVSGRSLLAFDEMVKLDIYYIENWSLWLDILILLRTIPIVLQARGAF